MMDGKRKMKIKKLVINVLHGPEQNLLSHVLNTAIHSQIPKTETTHAFAIQRQRTKKETPITCPPPFFF